MQTTTTKSGSKLQWLVKYAIALDYCERPRSTSAMPWPQVEIWSGGRYALPARGVVVSRERGVALVSRRVDEVHD